MTFRYMTEGLNRLMTLLFLLLKELSFE